jgi:glycosyltransferase involved in cell wall biosynthesis
MDSLSIVSPVYNEEKNIKLFYHELTKVIDKLHYKSEIIFINDGSFDNSKLILKEISEVDKRVKIINFRRNFGQTAAISAGIQYSSGNLIITIDSDLQNIPSDIPLLLDKINEGFDVVSGWRYKRNDNLLTKKIPSFIANKIISFISGVKLNDYGCTLKAYKNYIIKNINLYGEMHRFIPIYATWIGCRISEVKVNHNKRLHGKSNYGLNRFYKVILDLIVVKFLSEYSVKPIYFFGGIGILSILTSFIILAFALYLKFTEGRSLILTPLPLLSSFTFLTGITFLLLGLVAEILMRTYYESQNKSIYVIDNLINFNRE